MPTFGFPAGSNPSVLPPGFLRTPDSIVVEDDFTGGTNVSATVNAAKWLVAGVGTEVTATVATAESGGVVLLQSGATSANNCGLASNGCFVPATQRQIYGIARVKMASITSAAGFFGLCVSTLTNQNPLDKITNAVNTSDCIGFYIAAGGVISSVVGNGTTSVTTTLAASTGIATPAAVADTYIQLAFEVVGLDAVYFYVNHILCGKTTANIPTNVQAVMFDVQTATSAAKTFSLDYVNVSCGR